MLQVRRANDRGQTKIGWLDSRHSFSFGDYHDPAHMGFRSLRVINDDWIAGGGGFGLHPHRDMEILTYVLEGTLEHRDSLGHTQQLGPGEIQRMSAGTGIYHSEYNASKSEKVHLYQVWIQPHTRGLTPSYEQKPLLETKGLQLIAGPEGSGAVATIAQDAYVHAGQLSENETIELPVQEGRGVWVQVLRGKVEVEATPESASKEAKTLLAAGDAATLNQVAKVHLRARTTSEVLVFDLA